MLLIASGSFTSGNGAAVVAVGEKPLHEGVTVGAVVIAVLAEYGLSDEQGNFKFAKTDLPDEVKARLDELVAQLQADPKGAYFEIEGHTDNIGPKEVNERIRSLRQLERRAMLLTVSIYIGGWGMLEKKLDDIHRSFSYSNLESSTILSITGIDVCTFL